MTTAQLVIGIILIVFAVFLVVAVLLQQGKAHNLSGTIAGGAETFFGKSKAQTINKKLSILTTVVAIIFVGLVCSVYIMQDTGDTSDFSSFWGMVFGENEDEDAHDHAEETTAAEDTTAADETTAADDTTAVDDTTVADDNTTVADDNTTSSGTETVTADTVD